MLTSTTNEQERRFIADRLLTEIERRHGLPHPAVRDTLSSIIDRFLTVYLPESRDGELAPDALEYTSTATIVEALDFLRGAINESDKGRGAAVYVYDLDIGVASE